MTKKIIPSIKPIIFIIGRSMMLIFEIILKKLCFLGSGNSMNFLQPQKLNPVIKETKTKP